MIVSIIIYLSERYIPLKKVQYLQVQSPLPLQKKKKKCSEDLNLNQFVFTKIVGWKLLLFNLIERGTADALCQIKFVIGIN